MVEVKKKYLKAKHGSAGMIVKFDVVSTAHRR